MFFPWLNWALHCLNCWWNSGSTGGCFSRLVYPKIIGFPAKDDQEVEWLGVPHGIVSKSGFGDLSLLFECDGTYSNWCGGPFDQDSSAWLSWLKHVLVATPETWHGSNSLSPKKWSNVGPVSPMVSSTVGTTCWPSMSRGGLAMMGIPPLPTRSDMAIPCTSNYQQVARLHQELIGVQCPLHFQLEWVHCWFQICKSRREGSEVPSIHLLGFKLCDTGNRTCMTTCMLPVVSLVMTMSWSGSETNFWKCHRLRWWLFENQGDSEKASKITRQVSVCLQESNELAVQRVLSGSLLGPGTVRSLTLEEDHALSVESGGMLVQHHCFSSIYHIFPLSTATSFALAKGSQAMFSSITFQL